MTRPLPGSKMHTLNQIWSDGCDDALDGLPNRNPHKDADERRFYDDGYRVGSDKSIANDDPMAERRALGETARD